MLINIFSNILFYSLPKYKLIAMCLFFLFSFSSIAQQLKIISTKSEYKLSLDSSANNEMVNVKKYIPNIVLDLKYATTKNFMGMKLYYFANATYMRKQPTVALLKVQNQLNTKGLGIKIFDAYRPYRVTQKMWNLIHDDRYVANPANGSGHNRGTSIDLTIIDLKTGKELNMGTAFDNFTDSAHHSFTPNFSSDIIANRKILDEVMTTNGFKRFDTEWWHYSWISDKPYDLLDFEFKTMKKLTK